jgi:hypothetical protein
MQGDEVRKGLSIVLCAGHMEHVNTFHFIPRWNPIDKKPAVGAEQILLCGYQRTQRHELSRNDSKIQFHVKILDANFEGLTQNSYSPSMFYNGVILEGAKDCVY